MGGPDGESEVEMPVATTPSAVAVCDDGSVFVFGGHASGRVELARTSMTAGPAEHLSVASIESVGGRYVSEAFCLPTGELLLLAHTSSALSAYGLSTDDPFLLVFDSARELVVSRRVLPTSISQLSISPARDYAITTDVEGGLIRWLPISDLETASTEVQMEAYVGSQLARNGRVLISLRTNGFRPSTVIEQPVPATAPWLG